MTQYVYKVTDSEDYLCGFANSREDARKLKRICEQCPLDDEMPPYKIVRYEASNAKVVR